MNIGTSIDICIGIIGAIIRIHSPTRLIPREWNDVRNEVVWRIEGSRTNLDPRIQGALRFGKSRIWVFSVR